MRQFAKLFETTHGQILFRVRQCDETEKLVLSVSMDEQNNVWPEMSFGPWDDNDEAYRALGKSGQEEAEKLAFSIASMTKSFSY